MLLFHPSEEFSSIFSKLKRVTKPRNHSFIKRRFISSSAKTTCLIRNCLRCILKKKESLILFESIVRQTRELVCQDSPCASRVQKQNNESQQEKRSPHHDECAWSSALLPRVKYSAETNTNIRHITSHYEMHNFRSGGRVNVWIWLNLTMTSTVCHESFSGNNTTVRHDD